MTDENNLHVETPTAKGRKSTWFTKYNKWKNRKSHQPVVSDNNERVKEVDCNSTITTTFSKSPRVAKKIVSSSKHQVPKPSDKFGFSITQRNSDGFVGSVRHYNNNNTTSPTSMRASEIKNMSSAKCNSDGTCEGGSKKDAKGKCHR